jgi:hypothetical protein
VRACVKEKKKSLTFLISKSAEIIAASWNNCDPEIRPTKFSVQCLAQSKWCIRISCLYKEGGREERKVRTTALQGEDGKGALHGVLCGVQGSKQW